MVKHLIINIVESVESVEAIFFPNKTAYIGPKEHEKRAHPLHSVHTLDNDKHALTNI